MYIYIGFKSLSYVWIMSWENPFPALSDVPPAFTINKGSYRGLESPEDVVCFIKKYISDSCLSQDPLLVMTKSRAMNFQLVPDQKIPDYVNMLANVCLTGFICSYKHLAISCF